MAFAPITTVRLCRAVPLDNTYRDQLTFDNRAAQEAFFAGKTQYSAGDLSYQRENSMIRYPAQYDALVDCNYLCYRNPQFGDKWFYAFITNLEYESEVMTKIYFEIDAYQTYMFDINIPACFVEREHVNDDSVGANLIDEGLRMHIIHPEKFYRLVDCCWVNGRIKGYLFSSRRWLCVCRDIQRRILLFI